MVIKKSALVSGGSGFIGSHVIDSLLEDDYNVISISKNQPIGTKYNPKATYIVHDITRPIPKNILERISNVEYIVNCSGYIDHRSFESGGQSVFDNNMKSLINLVEIAKAIPLRTMIHLGSSDEYGDIGSPIDEKAREKPISPYSLSKVMCSHYLQHLFRSKSFPVIILRPFLIYGEKQKTDRFLPFIIKECINKKEFKVTEGYQLRDYCYVKDFTSAIRNCIENKSAYGEIINIGSGKPISIREVTNKVVNIIGYGKPLYGEVAYRDSESMALYPNLEKAKSILNWSANYEMEDSLYSVINWYKNNV
ncbi:NAD-dependent epimerase/dehydratase family protein [Prochlorococcus marinus]|uniref:Possible nucleoside-diphosphate-sugar epimerase n=1 Tax=Prochlorococcus marinus (strain MIT 9211) TaxID=93059 RepID=A9BBL3_PROM4|nr:NAD(P)-dependent oxidoreductase [Prochlorococcus marinus]ABX09225.1 possible nucleoside-diphosphate-sugar epimerase [Prochlorococcus marinus str. MIT 9211]